jgi:hypothetical protein
MTIRTTRLLMTASAAVMGAAGIAGSFLPRELLTALGAAPDPILTAIVQLLAALWLAAAMTNWTAKGNAIGGIYGRPIAVGNFVHFGIGAITLGKLVAAGQTSRAVLVAAGLYLLFAAAFAMVMFSAGPVAGSPRTPTSHPPRPTP